MQITIDTNNLSDMDIAFLGFLAEQSGVDEEPEPEAPAKPAKAAPKKAVQAVPDPEEDLLGGDGPTMSDAVAAATKLVSNGGAAKVKAALAACDAKRVSELDESKIVEFLAALEA